MDSKRPTRKINRRLLLTLHQDGLFDTLSIPLGLVFMVMLMASGDAMLLSGCVILYRFIKIYSIDN